MKVSRILAIPAGVAVLLAALYAAGPRPAAVELGTGLPPVPERLEEVEAYVRNRDAGLPVKPGAEGCILWGGEAGQQTGHVLLYLHGFTATRHEGHPLTHDFVRAFGVNAYLPRLYGHGLDVADPLVDMTPEALYASAREALAVAGKLGRKVVVMGTSTGCTLGLMLAADFPDLVEGLILYSPNIRIRNPFAPLLSGPWGLQITRLVHGGDFADRDTDSPYRVEAQVYLQQLLDLRMNAEEFRKVRQPVFLGYYYKDEEHQDPTVSVEAALRMFDALGTPEGQKRKVAFPEARTHVIACGDRSGAIGEVRRETLRFGREVLGLQSR